MNDQVKTADGYNFGGTSYKNEERTNSQGQKYTVAIPISSVTTVPQPQFKTPTPTTPTNYGSITTDLASQQDFALQQFQNQQEKTLSDTAQLQNALMGEGAFKSQQAEATGLNTANQEYIKKAAEISALGKQASQAQQENIAQGRQLGSVSSFVAGQGAEIERNRAIKALSLGAELDAIKGNIAVAQSKVDQAVEAQYAPLKQALTNKLQMFELNKTLYSQMSDREQKLYTRAKDIAEKEQKKIDQEIADKKDVQNMIIEATPNAPTNIIAKAKQLADKGASKLEVAQALGVYGGDYLKTQLLKAQIDTERAQKAKYYADIDKIKTEMQTKGLAPTTQNIAKVEASQSVYDIAQELLTAEGKGGAVGFGFKKSVIGSLPFAEGTAIAGTDRATYEAKFKQLKDTLASANLDKLKGAMSDKDIEFLRNIGTALSLDMPESAFDEELKKVQNTMVRVPGVQVKQTTPSTNKFNQALGVPSQSLQGTAIINSVDDNGNINFNLPK